MRRHGHRDECAGLVRLWRRQLAAAHVGRVPKGLDLRDAGANIMIYWVTETIGSSFLPYYDFTSSGPLTWMIEAFKQWTGSSDVPAAFAIFPKDISQPPREWAERYFNVQRWTQMPSGGHFAAMEEPELLVHDIRAFFRPLRSRVGLGDARVVEAARN